MMKSNILIALCSLTLLFSCSVNQSFLYSNLRYSKADQNKDVSTNKVKKEKRTEIKLASEENQEVSYTESASTSTDLDLLETSTQPKSVPTLSNSNLKKSLPNDSCDLIYTKNGEEIYGIISEVGITTVKYRSCDNINGPVYVVDKSDLVYIEFKNGEKMVIQSEKATPPPPVKPIPQQAPIYPGWGIGIMGFILSLINIAITFFGIALSDYRYEVTPLLILGILFSIGGIIISALGIGNNRFINRFRNYSGFGIAGVIISTLLFIIGIIAFVTFL